VKISTEDFNAASQQYREPSMAVLECKEVRQNHRIEVPTGLVRLFRQQTKWVVQWGSYAAIFFYADTHSFAHAPESAIPARSLLRRIPRRTGPFRAAYPRHPLVHS
jgi:hypothetical protein